MFIFYCFMSHVYFFCSKCIKQLLDLFFFRFEMYTKQLMDLFLVICKIINVEVRVINLAFGLANNSYLDNDSFAYHSKQIQ